ncbi:MULTISPECIES: hypothetical protein [unclassified Neorhizobium]|uniref:hypothetical protein n=1 Tax=unclassified Neorhizobium TaxID=2629175 RepID=UPI001FF4FFA4|nr:MULTISPECIES: hypothetical protein [unclassified Neorhizobium]MCJ9672157.1 hypothetical protein [Neorhizobium sp. SHOUNA12B]MCJ9748034.1 hypothetical protein [Neorhizobium sp. SHOUNA12A]
MSDLIRQLKELYPNDFFRFVASENIRFTCDNRYPVPISYPDPVFDLQVIVSIHIIDDGASYKRDNSEWTTAITIQKGKALMWTSLSFVSDRLLNEIGTFLWTITGGFGTEMKMNHEIPAKFKLKDHDPKGIRLAYNLGKQDSETAQAAFEKAVKDCGGEAERVTCGPPSALRVLLGVFDGFLSLQEDWTGMAAVLRLSMDSEAQILINGKNIGGAVPRMDQNKPFTVFIATSAFATPHTQEGSPLMTFLKN